MILYFCLSSRVRASKITVELLCEEFETSEVVRQKHGADSMTTTLLPNVEATHISGTLSGASHIGAHIFSVSFED